MITNLKLALITTVLLLQATLVQAQRDTTLVKKDSVVIVQDTVPARQHIAVFIPLYLDSAFDASGNYRHAKEIPKHLSPGLEFWQGVQLAIDSLQQEGVQADIHIYDTRSTKNRFETIVSGEEIKKMNLIIGHVTVNEAARLAMLASQLNIPFINANLPNDANVTNNPQYVVLNSTVYTHCAGIYKLLQRNFALSNITVFTKKGAPEDRLRQYFNEIEKSTASVPLKLKYVTLNPNFTLQQYLDSNVTNVCLVVSLDVNFAQNICQQLAALSNNYSSTVIGMPTWDVIDFDKDQFNGIEIYYSTPFYIAPTNKLATTVQDEYRSNFFVRPSDMVYRGFEAVYHFTHLLKLHGSNLGSSLADKKFSLFNEFDIQPVIGKQSQTLDYFENKKLYFVRMLDGVVKGVY